MKKLFETAMEGRWELVIEICINKKACQAKIRSLNQIKDTAVYIWLS